MNYWVQEVAAAIIVVFLYALAEIIRYIVKRRVRESAARVEGAAAAQLVRAAGGNGTAQAVAHDVASNAANAGPLTQAQYRNLFVGQDNRVSTSKTIVILWTVGVAYMVTTVALVAFIQNDPSGFLAATLNKTSDLYLVLLGGPYAAAIFAKVVVSNQVNSGSLQKTTGGGPNAIDVVTDDGGNTDVYDLQYTLFNLLVWVIVLGLFLPVPKSGLPDIPSFLAILTGGSALTYTVNKTTSGGNKAALQSVLPQTTRVGSVVKIFGQNLAVPTADRASVLVATVVTVGGTPQKVRDVTPSQITVEVVPYMTGPWPAAAQDVFVQTNGGDQATLAASLTVVGSTPVVDTVQPQPLSPTDTGVTVRGRWFLARDPSAAGSNAAPEALFSTPNKMFTGNLRNPDAPASDSLLHVDFTLDLITAIKAGSAKPLKMRLIRSDGASSEPYEIVMS